MANLLNYKKLLFSIFIIVSGIFIPDTIFSQDFSPQAGLNQSDAIHKDSSIFINWASSCFVQRGFINISDTLQTYNNTNRASFGADSLVVGFPIGNTDVVSLGDSGFAILSFNKPIKNGGGYDFAVFENGILSQNDENLAFLELAYVEVSTDSIHFFRFQSTSNTPFTYQIGSFDNLDARNINNLAGKYINDYGTPFDLSELENISPFLDINNVNYIKIIDVTGSISNSSYDSKGNIINDPFPTPFHSGGFDLNAVGVIHQELKKQDYDKKILLFPNPAKDFINIQNYTEDFKCIKIFSINGELLYSKNFNSIFAEINVSNFAPGVYFLNWTTENDSFTEKIIINR